MTATESDHIDENTTYNLTVGQIVRAEHGDVYTFTIKVQGQADIVPKFDSYAKALAARNDLIRLSIRR